MSKNRKYIVIPGMVTSINDGDRHFISSKKLLHLYGVEQKECVFTSNLNELKGIVKGTFKVLTPRIDGKYEVSKCAEVTL